MFLHVRNYSFVPFLPKVDNLERLFLARLQISKSKAWKPRTRKLISLSKFSSFFWKRHSWGRGEKLMVKIRINLWNMYMFNFIHMHFLFSSRGLFIWKIKGPTYVSVGSETKVSGIHLCQWGSQSAPMFLFFPLCLIKLGMSLMLWEVSIIKICEIALRASNRKRSSSTKIYALTG